MSRRKWRLMALVLAILTVVLVGCVPSSKIKTLTEENFLTLLTVADIQGVLTSEVPLQTKFYDYRKMTEAVDPEQVVDMESFYGLSFQTEDGTKGITLTVIDFNAEAPAQNHFEKVTTATAEELPFNTMDPPLGDRSVEIELNAVGFGSMIIFIKGDKVVLLHSVQPDGQQPLTSLKGLEQLAQIVEEKLQ